VNHYIDGLSTAGGDVGLKNSCQIAGFRRRAQDARGCEAARNSVWGCSRVNALVRTYPLPRDTAQTTLIVIIVMMVIIKITVIPGARIIMLSIMIIIMIIIIIASLSYDQHHQGSNQFEVCDEIVRRQHF
jgi:hypothetical protein